ncbi:ubiquitin carboxyl-terminal hydrolase [Drechmeria coniospora]|uniref:ubiquitinyl hydrolase 1 n=1 Tax=Drechmeria coniospora TaxID=98403 RepID=A0A151GMJ0_DRECN|nr:ubiquitin carboxyl-terminal hydrolase [Drechmeria coniospora]KYK58316.1 ubiquitin carboxyl-terminal hydrolase [Drechmeria coniospora]
MDPDADKNDGLSSVVTDDGTEPSSQRLPRAMSVDAPEMTISEAPDKITNQGESRTVQPPFSSSTSVLPGPHRASDARSAPPPLSEQVKIIETLLKEFADAPVKEGDVAYLVSRSWLAKALALRADPKSADVQMDADETSLGPVDNSDIIDEVVKDAAGGDFVRLNRGSDLNDFELFSETAWNLVVDWYGIKPGQVAITRTAVNTADSRQAPPNLMYEFHPPVFRLHRLWSEVSPLPIEQTLKAKNPPPLVLVRSATTHAQTFLKEVKTLADIPIAHRVRLSSVPDDAQPSAGPSESRSALTPPDSPGRARGRGGRWPKLLLDVASFAQTLPVRVQVRLADQTMNDKFNGQSTLQHYDLATDQTLVLDEAIGDRWVSTYTGREKASPKAIPSRTGVAARPSRPGSNRGSPAREGPLTRGRAQKKRLGRNAGAVGLHNLGNTCYMNSALQCVRSVEELTKYFLTESHLPEINQTNVLGYEGRVAIAYGNLLREIYEDGRSAVSPREFKTTVGRCRPTFSGWGQQDSQEFLGFLLDALQEDLSRIKKKPYIEKPDSTDDMINNPKAIREMADKVWDITRKRDDSVIADLFTGMYKSTLKCPECGKISITFDPFNNLTLPLPMEDMWAKTIKFLPLNDAPVKLEAELPKHSTVESLKKFVSQRTGVPVERLMGAEEFKDRFFKIYDNAQDVSEEIQSSDVPTMHELDAVPTNWPARSRQKKYRSMLDIDSPPESTDSDDDQCETMVVPVLHRRPQLQGRGSDALPPPHFITLTKAEASSMDAIQRKILEKVATFSTWAGFADGAREGEAADFMDGDVVVTTASDADSSGDAKVATRSVEGEDDIVDITMKGTDDKSSAQSSILKRFNTTRPRFLRAENLVDAKLQNVFELCYFKSDSDGTVPTGWSSVDGTRVLPKLADRIPELQDDGGESPESMGSPGFGNDDSSNDDEADVEESQTRMMHESSDEDASPVSRVRRRFDPHLGVGELTAPQFAGRHGRQNQRFGPGGRKGFKGQKTYGKKGGKRRDKQMRAGKHAHRVPAVEPQPMPPAVADGGPLVRLYEGVVVDWNEDAWEMLFGGAPGRKDGAQGAKTYTDLELLHDSVLKQHKRRRISRKNNGITLDECLDEFERAEVLSEQDMWYCPRCKEHRRASKKFDLWKTPDILVAHLKRFSSSGWRRDKLDILVEFPIENLDLTSRVIQKEEGKDEIYDLIGVDDHYGGLGGGHYTAYAKNFVDGRWYSFNGKSCREATCDVTMKALTQKDRLVGARRLGPLYEKESPRSEDEKSESDDDGEAGSKPRGEQVTDAPDDGGRLHHDGLVRRSIENDGIGDDMEGSHRRVGSQSLEMTQGWNFDGLEGQDGDCASDDAQFDSGDDGHGDVAHQGNERAAAGSREGSAQWEDRRVLSVPADGAGGSDVEEVTEIHLESDKAARSG